MLGVYNSRPPLSSSCCSEPQCTYVQLSPFYHLSTLDVTHVRKDLCILCATKNGRAWEQGHPLIALAPLDCGTSLLTHECGKNQV